MLTLITFQIKAQETIVFNIQYLNDKASKNVVFPSENIEVKSPLIKNILTDRLNNLYEQGYLSAWYDYEINEKQSKATFYTGSKFKLASLSKGNLDESLLNKVGYTERFYKNKSFSYKEISGLMKKIITWAENNGYPFASVQMDSIDINAGQISGIIRFDSGPQIVFDSIAITGMKDLKYKFLMSYLGIYRERPYRQELIEEIPQRIKTLEFLELVQQPDVFFIDGKAIIYLEVKKRKVNQVDGFIGFLPNETSNEKLLITGQVKLDLHNLLSSGKRLFVEWQRINVQSQLLDFRYTHPKLLRSPLDISGQFYLMKQDTTFINRDFLLRLSFVPGIRNKLAFSTDFRSSRLISTGIYEHENELPPYADFNLSYYGLEYTYSTFDDLFSPTRGLSLNIRAFAGKKTTIKNASLDDALYQGVDLQTAQYKLETDLDQYIGIWRNLLLHLRLRGGYLEGSTLFLNDLFRLGGLRTLRGFTENFFYASEYALANIELRTVFANNTYFLIFYDQGYIHNNLENYKADYPLGVGAGFSLVTNAGIFNFIFALGKSNNQDFGLNYSKIHFGYMSQF